MIGFIMNFFQFTAEWAFMQETYESQTWAMFWFVGLQFGKVGMVFLASGWLFCLFEPFWKFMQLLRSSWMPIIGVEAAEKPTLTVLDGNSSRRALEQAIPMLIAAEGTANACKSQIFFGFFDAESSILQAFNAAGYLHEALNTLQEARVEINGDLDYDVPAFIDPAIVAYNENKGLWFALAIFPRLLLAIVRVSRLRPQLAGMAAAARDLRMAAEEAYEKIDKPAAVVRPKLADRIPMVA